MGLFTTRGLAALLCAVFAAALGAQAAPGRESIYIHNGGNVVVRQLRGSIGFDPYWIIKVSGVAPQSSYLDLGAGGGRLTSGLVDTSGALEVVAARSATPKNGVLLFRTQRGMRASLLSISSTSYSARARTLTLTARQLNSRLAGNLRRLVDVPTLPLGTLVQSYGRQLLALQPSSGSSVYVQASVQVSQCSACSLTCWSASGQKLGPAKTLGCEAERGVCSTCKDPVGVAAECIRFYADDCLPQNPEELVCTATDVTCPPPSG